VTDLKSDMHECFGSKLSAKHGDGRVGRPWPADLVTLCMASHAMPSPKLFGSCM
jgi:hypothetical protein